MQRLSSITVQAEPQVREVLHHTPAVQHPAAPAVPAAAPQRRDRPAGDAPATNGRLRLGAAVRHGRFGTGRVIAFWPDGTVQVRFEGLARIRMVWPSVLQPVGR